MRPSATQSIFTFVLYYPEGGIQNFFHFILSGLNIDNYLTVLYPGGRGMEDIG
jgi:hypothetical protein